MKYEEVAEKLTPEVQVVLYHGLVDAAKRYILEDKMLYSFEDFYDKNFDSINLMMSIPTKKDEERGAHFYTLLVDYFQDKKYFVRGLDEFEYECLN